MIGYNYKKLLFIHKVYQDVDKNKHKQRNLKTRKL